MGHHGLCRNFSTLLLWYKSSHKQHINPEEGCVPIKLFFLQFIGQSAVLSHINCRIFESGDRCLGNSCIELFGESSSSIFSLDNCTLIRCGTFLIPLIQTALLSLVSMYTSGVPSPSGHISGSFRLPEEHTRWNLLHGCACECCWCILWSSPHWCQNGPPSHDPSLQEPFYQASELYLQRQLTWAVVYYCCSVLCCSHKWVLKRL